MNNKKIAIILSGCGVFDGAEIQESVMAMYAVAKEGFTYRVFAPDINQHHVINHITGEEMNQERNVMVEAARIARGEVSPLSEYNAVDFNAALFPGGFGAAKNLSDYAFKGNGLTVLPQVKEAILQTVKLNKPIGALCISPVILASALKGVKVTVGDDTDAKSALLALGAENEDTDYGEIVIDEKYKTVTAPCYNMNNSNIVYVQKEAEKVVKALIELME